MRKFKKFGLAICLGLCLAATGGGIAAINAYADEASGTEVVETAANTVNVTTNFGTLSSLSADSAIVESKGVSVCASPDHGAIPSDAWGDPYLIADQSYMIYEIKATSVGENQVFDTLKLNLNAKMWGQNDGTAYGENAINVYIGTSPATATYLVQSYTPGSVSTGGDFGDFGELDLSTIAAGYGAAYIKIEMKQSKNANCGQAKDAHNHGDCGTVASSDGYIAMWNAGVKMKTVSITATTKEGEAVATPDYTLSSDFTKNKLDACNVYDKKGVASDGNEHGLVPAEAWDGWVKVPAESYVVYKLDADKGKAFSSLTMDLSAKLWNQNDGACHENNKINVYLSPDGTNWTPAVASAGCGDATDGALTVSDFALPYIADASYKTVYVKIELVQYVQACGQHMLATNAEHHNTCGSGKTTADGYVELWHLGVKLYTVNFEGTYKDIPVVTVNYNDGDTTLYTDEYQEKDATLYGYTPAEKENYEFKGWYLDKELTTALPENYVATENVTLYAKYSPIEYAIDYVLDGGVNAESNPATYTADDEITLAAPTKENYEFKGWYATADFAGEAVTTISGATKAEVVLYAKWEAVELPPVDDNSSSSATEEPEASSSATEEPEASSSEAEEPVASSSASDSGADGLFGCFSSVGGALVGAIALGAAAVLLKKKED